MAWRTSIIRDSEILLRRIPPVDQDPDESLPPPSFTFRPTDKDTDGLSLWRARYVPVIDVAKSPRRPGRIHRVAAIVAKELRERGMDLVVDPKDYKHILISNLNPQNRENPRQREWRVAMATELAVVHKPKHDGIIKHFANRMACLVRRAFPWT